MTTEIDEEREYYRNERIEQERREDIEWERSIWHETVQNRLADGASAVDAIAAADKIIAAYKERFQ